MAQTTIQSVNTPDSDYSYGMDARSSENQIEPGFVRDLLNSDIVERRVKKRVGYQGYAGNIPVRVTGLTYTQSTGMVCFSLDSALSLESSIALESVRSTPIVAYGRSSVFTTGQGPFTTDGDTVHYYTGFTVPTRKTLSAPTGPLAIPGTEHGLNTSNLFVGVVQSSSLVDRSYSDIITDGLTINESNYGISIDYTVASDTPVFVYYADEDAATGSSYVASIAHTGSPISQLFTITAGTHDLASSRIIPMLYQESGSGTRLLAKPDSFLILPNGDVQLGISNGTGATVNYKLLLSTAPVSNIATGSVSSGTTGTVTLTGLTKPWLFYGIYISQTPGGNQELVIADSVVYDDSTQTAVLTFTNLSPTAQNYSVYYEYGAIRSNQLCVTDTVTVTGSDSVPQLTLWGLDHDEIYQTKVAREGWVTHIDNYRRNGEQRLVTGLGGNLFAARSYAEAATQYGYPVLYPNLSNRTSSDIILAPLFWDTGETPGRSRGYITSDASGTNWAVVSGVQYDSGTGWTVYTISLPNKQILDSTGAPTSLTSVISTSASLQDQLTIQNMSYSRHNGTFTIEQVVDGTNEIQVYVSNSSNSSDYDDLGVAGEAAVFTDQLQWNAISAFVPGDSLLSEPFGSIFLPTVVGNLGTTSVLSGIINKLDMPGGVLVAGSRTSTVVPLRLGSPSSSPDTDYLVEGDMLSYTGIPRLVRVLSINPDTNRNIAISGNGVTATATLATGTSQYLAIGMSVQLTQAGPYDGIQVVTNILGTTQFTFSSVETVSVPVGVLQGKTVELDEQLGWSDTLNDSNSFAVQERWIPLEAPDDTYTETNHTHVRYLDTNQYTTQPFLRSSMVADNMYLTNNDDPVYKMDGQNIYRAGLPSWQPGVFITQDSTNPDAIAASLRSFPYSAINSAAIGQLTISVDDQNSIPVGTSVLLPGDPLPYVLSSYSDNTATGGIGPFAFYVNMDRAIASTVTASGTVMEIGNYTYYFRLNAVDANNNIIASAVTGSQDHIIQLVQNAAINIKLVGLPAWDVYNYTKIEVQIYRTKLNQPAPFYLVTTVPLKFDNGDGYIDPLEEGLFQYTDSFTDTDLTSLDVTSSVLKAGELGIGWSDPILAKYITSTNNSLVLGNVTDYPQLDMSIVAPGSSDNSTFSGGSLLFRKDGNDTGTSSDMVNRVRYEWVTTTGGVVAGPTATTDQFTVTIGAPAAVGDWIYLTYSSVNTIDRDLTFSGWWQIAAVSGAGPYILTINAPGIVTSPSSTNTYVLANTPGSVPVLLGVDGNMGMYNGNLWSLTTGGAIFDVMRRTSIAINATMRMTDRTISGMEAFQPWLMARGGNDTPPAGRMVVRQPITANTTISVEPTFSGYQVFLNSIQGLTGQNTGALARTYPSRILASYQSYPEIFDNPTAILDIQSNSAVDVNPSDGQEITGIIPFFGAAAFTAAQQAAILVVFKTNSIYLVDLNQKNLGNSPVQRLETEGLGCTVPFSISSTKNGIMFANESGVYCLRPSQQIEYVGKYLERNWLEKVDRGNLGIAHGHHFGVGRSYRLSVPILSDETSLPYIQNTQTLVYDHTLEGMMGATYGVVRLGAWGRYDTLLPIGWANVASDEYYCDTEGRVYSRRRTGTQTDYRDDNQAINMLVDLRPNDFGSPGIRKVLDAIVIHYRTGATSLNTKVNYSVDLEQEYSPTTPVIIRPVQSNGTDLSDAVGQDILSIRHNIDRRRGGYFNMQILNSGIDENIEIAGVEYKVGGLSEKGYTQAAQTK